MLSFNPIKVLFLLRCKNINDSFLSAFNPIKVLFLHRRSKPFSLRWTSFQSYQGSIFTVLEMKKTNSYSIFQSYQGSIFTQEARKFLQSPKPFNPIKVLFLHDPGHRKRFYKQLSILSRFYFYNNSSNARHTITLLSILSRFYFYAKQADALRTDIELSILSRFYFYMTMQQ